MKFCDLSNTCLPVLRSFLVLVFYQYPLETVGTAFFHPNLIHERHPRTSVLLDLNYYNLPCTEHWIPKHPNHNFHYLKFIYTCYTSIHLNMDKEGPHNYKFFTST